MIITRRISVVSKKNDLFVDQLANAKHENDMINALLKRKERRIIDLEDQYSELSSANESLTLNNKNMKIRCDNLQESSSSSIAEYERLKIAYDALIASQVEYKRHYEKELNDLTSKFELYKKQNLENFNNLSAKLTDNDKDIDTLVESLTNKRKTMDNLYVNKNKTVLDFLSKLAKIAKLHGQESKAILQDNVENIKMLVEKYPDLPMKLNALEETDLDLESVINESNDTLSYSSFDDDTTLTSSPDLLSDATFNSKTLSRGNSISMKKERIRGIRLDLIPSIVLTSITCILKVMHLEGVLVIIRLHEIPFQKSILGFQLLHRIMTMTLLKTLLMLIILVIKINYRTTKGQTIEIQITNRKEDRCTEIIIAIMVKKLVVDKTHSTKASARLVYKMATVSFAGPVYKCV